MLKVEPVDQFTSKITADSDIKDFDECAKLSLEGCPIRIVAVVENPHTSKIIEIPDGTYYFTFDSQLNYCKTSKIEPIERQLEEGAHTGKLIKFMYYEMRIYPDNTLQNFSYIYDPSTT